MTGKIDAVMEMYTIVMAEQRSAEAITENSRHANRSSNKWRPTTNIPRPLESYSLEVFASDVVNPALDRRERQRQWVWSRPDLQAAIKSASSRPSLEELCVDMLSWRYALHGR